jgi:hypothetical protein
MAPAEGTSPATGIAAWQATLGYIHAHHAPDAMLEIRVAMRQNGLRWAAVVRWGEIAECVSDCLTLPDSLHQLWDVVDAHHIIFEEPSHGWRAPAGYEPHNWLDLPTLDILHRFLWTARSAFREDWQLYIFYRVADVPHTRVRVRLLADQHRLVVGASGPTIMQAMRHLFRNAADSFALYSVSNEL